ncbi:19031_t:CDS:2 [Racocetra fulgida]|uniref:19031_t:CDS:1 n=1 Tax=Racocetra fulgida TaxID=60492 RepID=A0A9N9G7W3_9GLOM|nr:19031_t:CDS:2 [Racocetra fulgida]
MKRGHYFLGLDDSRNKLPRYYNSQIHIYRIIGNDLPPRHKVGQVLQNTRFILENEPDFPNSKKWWIINRIVDSDYENAIIDLLKQHKKDFIRIPFDVNEYLKADFRLEDFPEPDFFHSYEFMNFTKNGGRNIALMHGQSQPNARWIFPFDGNCFLTNNAFTEITSQLEKWGNDYKYFVVPMARLLNNSELLSGTDQKPPTPEEPQIIFRYDAEERYNENMRYGVPTPTKFVVRPVIPWENNDDLSNHTSDNRYMIVGWIYRLFSGQASQELNHKEAGALRAFNRLLAIQELIDGIDERIARNNYHFSPANLFLYNEKSLNNAKLKYWSGNEKITRIVDILLDRANEITSAISDFYGIDDFLSTKKSSILIEFLKFKTDPETNLLDGESNEMPDHVSSTSQLFQNITTLTLANYFSGNSSYARWAANLVRTFLLSSHGVGDDDKITLPEYNDHCTNCNTTVDEGYGFPYLNKIPRTIPKFTKNSESNDDSPMFYKIPKDISEIDPSYFLDSCKLLYRIKALTHREFIELKALVSYWLEYLISSPEGISMARRPDHRGTLYDLQVLSLSGFIDDVRLFLRVSNRLRMRIGKQFYIAHDASLTNAAKISQPYEMMYVKNMITNKQIKPSAYEDNVFKYKSLNLQYWMLITRTIQNVKISNDLWLYQSKDGQNLLKAIISHLNKYSNKYLHTEGNREQIMKDNLFLLKPLLHIACAAHETGSKQSQKNNEHGHLQRIVKKFSEKYSFDYSDYSDKSEKREYTDMNVGLGSEIGKSGIPPFWMFGVA